MRKILFGSIFLLLISLNLSGQNDLFVKSSFKGELEKYFSQELVYPDEMMIAGKSGFAELEFQINVNGKLDLIELIKSPSRKCSENIIKILSSTKHMWTPTKQNGKDISYKYRLVVDYRILKGSENTLSDSRLRKKASKLFQKKKFLKALELIDEAIVVNPYESEYYELKAQILAEVNEVKKSKDNAEVAKYMEKQIMGHLYILAYGLH